MSAQPDSASPRFSSATIAVNPVNPVFRYFPALESLRRYNTVDARGDVVAGLSVAAVAVPQAMAYALIAGLPPSIGLNTAIVMTAVGSLLASSRQLINGPTNAISIALLGAIGSIEDPAMRVQAGIFLALMIGVIQLTISLARLGDLTRYISHSVIVGFTAGASLLLVLDQLKNLLGQQAMAGTHDHFLLRVWRSLVDGGPIHGPTLAIGVASILLVLLLRAVKRKLRWPLLPELLLVVVIMAGVTYWLHLNDAGVRVVGAIPASLPGPSLPAFDPAWIREFSSSALAIGLLGLLEAVSMSKMLAAKTREKLDLNQQCLSEGVANIAGGFFSCMPGSGSLTRSAINQQAGARTQWAGIVAAIGVATMIAILAPFVAYVPRSALAGILVVTAASMVDFKDLKYHVRASRFDAVLVWATAISAFAISIEFCVMIGVFMSFLLAVPRAGNMLLTEFVEGDARDGHVRERLDDDEAPTRILVFGLEGELFFGSSVSLANHIETIESRVVPETRVVVMRMKRVRNADAVGLAAIAELVDRLHERGVDVLLCGVRPRMRDALERAGIIARLPAGHVFLERPVRQTSTQEAMRCARAMADSPPTVAAASIAG